MAHILQMKILFIGDYSNLHACLAGELRHLGHDVTIVSDGGAYMRTSCDKLLVRKSGFRGAVKYLIDVMALWPSLKGYDVVQLINPHFLKLKPGKLAYFFNELRRANKSVWLTLCGNDHFFIRAAVRDSIFRFSELRVGSQPTPFAAASPQIEKGYLLPEVANFTELLYDKIDGAMSVLPEYDMAARPILGDRCHFTNIPISLASHPYTDFADDGPVKVFVGMKPEMSIQKGTALLLDTVEQIAREYPDRIIAEKVGGISYTEYLAKMRDADVVIDQLYSYSPATNALDAMALGKVAASGAQPEYFDFIRRNNVRDPEFLIPLSPLIPDLRAHLEEYLLDRKRLKKMARTARAIVERENDSAIVAQRFLNAWQNLS